MIQMSLFCEDVVPEAMLQVLHGIPYDSNHHDIDTL